VLDLLRIPLLRNTFIVSLVLAMGWDLYTFLTPLYGARLGLAATKIGVIMSTFALATVEVALLMPHVVKRLRQWVVMSSAMAVAGAAYILFPLFSRVPVLMALSFLLGLCLCRAAV